jgi:hypothetical protein
VKWEDSWITDDQYEEMKGDVDEVLKTKATLRLVSWLNSWQVRKVVSRTEAWRKFEERTASTKS